MNVGTPEEALRTSLLPTDGVGLLRMEFVFASHVRVHPLALTRFETLPKEVRRQVEEVTEAYPDKRAYFVERLSEGIGLIAAAFYPRPVLLRFSDFKTNEYARLLGGTSLSPRRKTPCWGGGGEPLLPPGLQGGLPPGGGRGEAGAGGDGPQEPHGHGPLLPHPGGGGEGLGGDGRGGLRRGEGGPRST